MRVSELAKELGVPSEAILAKLKSLHLKAKDKEQELNTAVIPVLRRELKGSAKTAVEKPKEKEASLKKEIVAAKKTLKHKEEVKGKSKKEPAKSKTKKTSAGKETKEKEKPKTLKVKPSPVLAVEQKSAPAVPVQVQAPKPVAAPVAPAPIFKKLSAPIFQRQGRVSAPAMKMAEEKSRKPLLDPVEVEFPIAVKDLAIKFQQKPSLLLKELMQKGIMANINQYLDEATGKDLAGIFGVTLAKVKTQEETLIEIHQQSEEDKKSLKPRPPVVTFMGHVDHGKTSLLDSIRKTKVVDKEHGGITQHIGAYSVILPKGRITFLDTPGHEAFTSMRSRGAHITDLVVLVVAADEGIMPQTDEAIDHARAANVPIIVALNKIDKKTADPERVKKQLSERGLMAEDWGGKTIVAGVSATTGQGIDSLLESILLEAELLELRANYEKKASGIVVEAKLSQGRGPVATMIVQNGMLHEGDTIVVGSSFGRVKAMCDDRGRAIKEAGPATPAEILGLSGVPEAGEKFYVVEDEKRARDIASRRETHVKNQKMLPSPKISLEDLYAQIQEGKVKELNIIVKADVQGSLEALKDSLLKIISTEVQLKIIHTGVGDINNSDIILAGASNAIIIGFHVDVNDRAKPELEKQQVDVRTYRIIYDAINDVRNALTGLLEPKTKKKFLARVEIRQVFNLSSKAGKIAGCFVAKGRVTRKANIDLVRNGKVVFTGALSSLKRFKDDVREVAEGFECGIAITNFNDIEAGDVIEAYELEKIARTL